MLSEYDTDHLVIKLTRARNKVTEQLNRIRVEMEELRLKENRIKKELVQIENELELAKVDEKYELQDTHTEGKVRKRRRQDNHHKRLNEKSNERREDICDNMITINRKCQRVALHTLRDKNLCDACWKKVLMERYVFKDKV